MPDRHRQRAGHVAQQADAEILLQVGDAAVHALQEPARLLLRVGRLVGVGVEPDAVAELAAEHLPRRHAPRLAREIHERHLDPAHAAGLPRVPAELLDLPEHLVDVAGVLAEHAALEEERVGLARAVAHLAVAGDALVGVDANERTGHRRLHHDRHAEVGDRQR
jgi:hypothetical protein